EKALPAFGSWREALETTARTGYDFLEMSIDESDERIARLWWSSAEVRPLRQAIADTGVPVRHLCLSGHRRFPFASADHATREKAWEMMRRAIDLSVEVGVRIIQTQGHDVYYEESTSDTQARYRDGLARAAEMCREASVMLALENADLPMMGSLDQTSRWIEACGNPWLQMYPDLGNSMAHGHDVVDELPRNLHHIAAVHVKDARPGEFRRVAFGEGIVPFENAFAVLDELGYRGPLVIEMWNENNEDPEAVIRDARTWVLERMK
ncbi:MAG: L-ribulose-5-phosphate 3-epimerase, partial [Alkalispirochaeta sp.]